MIGIPDPARTAAVGAFAVLRDGQKESAALTAELQDHVRKKRGAHQYPRQVYFLDTLHDGDGQDPPP